MMRGLIHLNLNVSDIDRSERFYVEALGFVRLTETSGDVEHEGRRIFLKQVILGRPDAHDLLALSEAPGATVGPGGMVHCGLVVEDGEVARICERVDALGGSMVESGRRSFLDLEESFAYIRDPDGYMIEVSPQLILYSMASGVRG